MNKKGKINSYASSAFPDPKYLMITRAVDEFGDEIAHGIYDTEARAQADADKFNNVYKYAEFGEAYVMPVPYYKNAK